MRAVEILPPTVKTLLDPALPNDFSSTRELDSEEGRPDMVMVQSDNRAFVCNFTEMTFATSSGNVEF